MKLKKNSKINIFLVLILFVFLNNQSFSQDKDVNALSGNDVNSILPNTIASVVKLSSLVHVYTVDNLNENYIYKEKDGYPDFENGIIVSEKEVLMHVGTGVVITPNGLIISNAHVTDCYSKPIINYKYNPAGNVVIGGSGNPVMEVIVPVYPNYMFVGVTKEDEIVKNNEKQKLSYLAEILLQDSDYNNQIRDRAVLQIVRTVNETSDKLPYINENYDIVPENLSYVELGNPFDIVYNENDVKAIGFPGVGDPNRASKTSGEFLGYESENYSNLLHTSWISNGNSGGGLFYRNKLIGINTWDNRNVTSRPVAIAQPISYWFQFFAYLKYLRPNVKLPEYDNHLIDLDPSYDEYKRKSCVTLSLVEKNNTKMPVSEGVVLVYRQDLSIDDIINYQQYEEYFNNVWNIVVALWNNPVEVVLENFDVSLDSLNILKNVSDKQELKSVLAEGDTVFYDWWAGKEFIYSLYDIFNNGNCIAFLPNNTKVNISYVNPNGDISTKQVLKIENQHEQGPYVIKIKK